MKDKLYKMMNWPEIEAIVYGEECHPEKILGRHNVSAYTLFQAFFPDAKEVILTLQAQEEQEAREYIMELADEAGFYAVALLGKVKDDYQYVVTDINGKKNVFSDPYNNMVKLSKSELNAFRTGKSTDAYKFMGARKAVVNNKSGVAFHVWAPNAVRVSIVGDFNNWNGKVHPMILDENSGIFSLFIPGLNEAIRYKYEIRAKGGAIYTKLDPYSPVAESGNSVVTTLNDFEWTDAGYLENKKRFDKSKAPFNICEITNFTDLIDDKGKDGLIRHLKDCSYNYIRLSLNNDLTMGFTNENANELKTLVNLLHKENIGILFDVNFSYFKDDETGLSYFDGTYLYGHLDERKRYNTAFGGRCFNYGRPEVATLLNSKIYYLLRELHIDGLFVEGLSSMLYLDYGKNDGEWTANIYGGNENLEAIHFVKELNQSLHQEFSYAITLTREEGLFPKVTEAISDGGLGFDYIINNGFGSEFLDFIKGDNSFTDLNKLTDNMAYAYCENYVLSIAKEDILLASNYDYGAIEQGADYFDVINLNEDEKEAAKRSLLAYFMARPGKKLLNINVEDGKSLPVLGKLYKELPALHSLDRNPYGFEWIKAMNTGDGVLSFVRKDEYLNHSVLVVCNFSDNEYAGYKFGMPYEGKYKLIFSSDDKKFGGKTTVGGKNKETVEEFYDGRHNSLTLKLAPMTTAFYSYTPYNEEELLKIAQEKVAKYKAKVEKEAKEKAKALKEANGAVKEKL